LLNGKSASTLENLSFLGELSQTFSHSLLSFVEKSCFTADALIGRGERRM